MVHPSGPTSRRTGGCVLPSLVMARTRTTWSPGSTSSNVIAHCTHVSAEIAVYNRGPVPIVEPAELQEYSPGPVELGFDGSDESIVAAEFAVAQARTLGATLRVVSASSMPTMNRAEQLNPDLYLHAVERAQDTFEQSWRAWAEQHAEGVEWEFVGDVGAPARSLADHSEDAGMIVVGSRGLGGFGRLLLGSTSRSLLFQATRAVAIVRPEKR